jgi:RNA polymerase sigma factor (sigma-70 family)
MLLPGSSPTNTSSHRLAHKPDSVLVNACLSGDEDAWNTLIERYRALIYKLALSMGLSTSEAADVLQEVCLLLVEHLGELRDRTKLTQWLVITTRREVWRALRQRPRYISVGTIEYDLSDDTRIQSMADCPTDPEQTALALEDQALVRQAMACLPDRCRKLLTLLCCEDPPCSYAEVSSRLEMPVNSIGPNRVRCLQQLKKILSDLGF